MAKQTEIPTDTAGIRKALERNTRDRARVSREDAALLEERDRLFTAARDADPPIVVREIAQLTGLTEVAINKRLKQIRSAG